jgi:DNA-binding SARP family transcriptional activator/pimeloyl-ACP methyl ester carboxylesterase
MRYRVLGAVEAVDDTGSRVDIGTGRQTALLAALVARAGRVVSTDELVDLLWGDDPPTQPANALQVLVSRLRSALRHDESRQPDLETRAPGYVLTVDHADIDAGIFENEVSAAAETDPSERVDRIRDALAMWHGRAYGEYADSDIARLEALRLEEMHKNARVELGAALVAEGRSDEALLVLEPFVAEQPFHERARTELMMAMYAQGRHAEALEVYRDYRMVLGEELGLEPSAALQQVELDILRHDVVDTAAPERRPDPPSLAKMTVRYLATEAEPLAWTKLGSGPRLAVVPAWVTGLDVMASGRDPRSSILERLAAHAELVLYDRRGTGLSRGPVDDFSVEAGSRELESVLEASGGPTTLLAVSQAGPTALTLAVRRPELVSGLVLFGTFASGPATFTETALSTAIVDLVRSHWGVGSRLFATLYRPDASDAVAEHLGQVLRDSAPRDVAAGYLETVYTTDVVDLLADVRCPTLVIHYRDDRVIPFAGGQQLATTIPNAELMTLDGRYHLPDAADLDAVVTAIVRFLPR